MSLFTPGGFRLNRVGGLRSIRKAATGLPVTSGLTGRWISNDIDGYNNSTLTDGYRISTWADQSGNGYDLYISGGERPTYQDADTSGDSPTYEVMEFSSDGAGQHRIGSYPDVDFELFLPSDGKSAYAVVNFVGAPAAWILGFGRNIVSDGGQGLAKWGIEYAKYTTSNTDYNIVFHQDGSYVDNIVIGTAASPATSAGKYIISMRQDGYSAGTDNYFLECHNPSFSNSTQGEVADSQNMNWFNILRCFNDTPTVEAFEVLTYSRALSDAENQQVVNYLSQTWGVGV